MDRLGQSNHCRFQIYIASKMKYIAVLVLCLAVFSASESFELVEDEIAQEYYMEEPLHRERRQTKWGISEQGVKLGHQGTILNNDNHRLDGSAYLGKNFDSPGVRPDQFGGRLDYQHKPSSSGVFIAADNMRGYGTDLNAGAKLNLYERKNFNVDLTGQYGRHFGGPGGTGRPEAGVFLNAVGRF